MARSIRRKLCNWTAGHGTGAAGLGNLVLHLVQWVAANRDPRTFDDPTAIKIVRNTDAGRVWGQGINLCQGAPLARLDMRVALEELLSRTKRFELADVVPRCLSR